MGRSARVCGVGWLVVATVLVGGCSAASHDPKPSTGHPPAASAPASPKAHRPYSDVNPPPRHAGDFTVKVLTVSRGELGPDGRFLPRRSPAQEFWGEEVRVCVNRSSHDQQEVGWADWRAEGTDGRLYVAHAPAGQTLPTPTYPAHTDLAPGECAVGWWLIPVPKGPVIRAIQFAPAGGPPILEWVGL